MFTCVALLNNFNSAKLAKDGIAPQTSYAHVFLNGLCIWMPFFPLSVSHCSIDSTWFPFDEQSCNLIYQSWKYHSDEVILTTTLSMNDSLNGVTDFDFFPDDLWDIISKCILCIMYQRLCVYLSARDISGGRVMRVGGRPPTFGMGWDTQICSIATVHMHTKLPFVNAQS